LFPSTSWIGLGTSLETAFLVFILTSTAARPPVPVGKENAAMRRIVLATAVLSTILTFGLVGVAGAAHVKPGGKWTLTVVFGSGTSCESQTFGPGHTWTGNPRTYNDAGTYTGGAKSISETFTSGVYSSSTFEGTYRGRRAGYVGEFDTGDSQLTAALTKGVLSSC
jgi:hypothetical protein